jgi:hypothetical protein
MRVCREVAARITDTGACEEIAAALAAARQRGGPDWHNAAGIGTIATAGLFLQGRPLRHMQKPNASLLCLLQIKKAALLP